MATSSDAQYPKASQYGYSVLKGDHDSRLLFLEPVDDDKTLRGSLKPVNIQQVAATEGFYALSYCWGTEAASQTIFISDLPFAVRPNMLAALLAIYEACEPVRSGKGLWVDALCIDQNDNADKSKQVRRMGDIYREATSLIIWLGEADTVSGRFMPTLQLAGLCELDCTPAIDKTAVEPASGWTTLKSASSLESLRDLAVQRGIGQAVVDSIRHALSILRKDRHLKERAALIAHFQAELPRLSPKDNIWSDLIRFLNRPWFARVWTFQEVMCHQHRDNTLVLCGSDLLDYGILEIMLWLVTLGSGVFDKLTGLDGDTYQQDVLAKMSLTMNLTHYRPGQGGMFLLDSMRSRLATDPRDYVYGILSLVPSTVEAQIPVDYSLSAPTLYFKSLTQLCKFPSDLTILLRWWAEPWTWMRDHGRNDDTSPSWCPDFSRRAYASINNPLLGLPSLSSKTMSRLASRRPPHSFSKNSRVLSLGGLYLDTIIEATTIASHPSVPNMDIHSPLQAQIQAMLPNAEILTWLHSFLIVWHQSLMTLTAEDPRWKTWEKQFFCPWNPEEEDSVDESMPVPKALQELIYFELRLMMAGENDVDLLQPVSLDWLYILANVRKVANICKWRYFFFTKNGNIGVTPVPISKGDHVYCFSGEFLEVVSADRRRLVSPTSVEGLMGDALIAKEDQWEMLSLS